MARGRRPTDWRIEGSFPLADMLSRTGGASLKDETTIPDFLTEFLPHVRIESDSKPKRAIPFQLWDFQQEVMDQWLEGKDTIWLKRRQIGASWMMAAYDLWTAAYHEASHVGIISKGQVYSDEMMRRIRYIEARLPIDMRRKYHGGVQRLEFATTGSLIMAFPSREDAAISFTFDLINMDELAFHPYGKENYGAVSPALDAGGQLLATSTADPELGESGFFWELWQDSLNGDVPYVPIFTGRFARPDQQDEWWEGTKSKYKGNEDAMHAFYPETWEEAFVGKSGLALPGFSRSVNVRSTDPMTWDEYDWRIFAIDPGGGDPTAITVNGVWRDRQTGDIRFHQPAGGEFYSRDPVDVDDIVRWLAQWGMFDAGWLDTAGGTVLLNTLKRYGYPIRKAIKDRATGLSMYNTLLATGRLTHHVSNSETLAEYPQYRLLTRKDPNDRTRYNTSTAVDNHADAKDTQRYQILGFHQEIGRAVAANPNADLKLVWSA